MIIVVLMSESDCLILGIKLFCCNFLGVFYDLSTVRFVLSEQYANDVYIEKNFTKFY